jgi:hypothetical protein
MGSGDSLSTQEARQEPNGLFGLGRSSATIPSALIALKVAFLFVLAWNTRFVMDEFQQLGWAKYLGNGLFDNIWHPKAVGYVLFYKLAHLIGWNAVSILLIGRIQTAILACATLAIIYACARALGNDRLRSLVIILVLLSFSNFMERIFRTIAEPLAVFFAAAALLVVLRGRADQARTVVIAGLLSGLSFLATQKAVYFNVALGLGLVADAMLARRFGDGLKRGAGLVLGWLLAIVAYCFVFGGMDPVPIAKNLFFGPVEVATKGGEVYTNLRHFVWQTLTRNAVLYAFCFIGMLLALLRVTRLDERQRIALIFTMVVTALVFAHNQPWPYVFIMALPFMALWSLTLLDRIAGNRLFMLTGWVALGIPIAISYVKNVTYLEYENAAQLELVARAEKLVGPNDRYFDAVGMLPNRMEPSTLWLGRAEILKTLREGKKSEAYRILAYSPPKIILWSYRMDAIEPVVRPLIQNSYVQIAPNLRVAGRRLKPGEPVTFDAPIPGTYALYSAAGKPLRGKVEIDGAEVDSPVSLSRGRKIVTLRTGHDTAFLLPSGPYGHAATPGGDNDQLFAGVYD